VITGNVLPVHNTIILVFVVLDRAVFGPNKVAIVDFYARYPVMVVLLGQSISTI